MWIKPSFDKRDMFVDHGVLVTAIRQEAMFVDSADNRECPPSGVPCL